jgi:uncharacterized membrane protein
LEKTSTGIQANIAGLLCYVLGWVTGIIFLIIEKDSKFVRFHAWQSIITFGALTVLSFIPVVNLFVGIVSLILWVVLMVFAYQGKMWKVPVAGNIAEQQAK